jgi:hypothetical protein
MVIVYNRCYESVEVPLAKAPGFAPSQYAIGSRCTTRIAGFIHAAQIASITAGDVNFLLDVRPAAGTPAG